MLVSVITKHGINKSASQDCVLINNQIYNDYQGEMDTIVDNICIADGVGGVLGGYEASRFVMEQFAGAHSFNNKTELREYLEKINEKLIVYASETEGKSNMATTFTGIIAKREKILYMHAGNTRLYSFAHGELEQISTDHTNYQFFIDEGMTEVAENTPKNVIHTCFGTGNPQYLKRLEVEDFIPIYTPDMIILTSDGIHDYVDNDLMEYILQCASKPFEAARLLVEAAVKNGSEDDTTVVIATSTH